jgi:hypothetical protein
MHGRCALRSFSCRLCPAVSIAFLAGIPVRVNRLPYLQVLIRPTIPAPSHHSKKQGANAKIRRVCHSSNLRNGLIIHFYGLACLSILQHGRLGLLKWMFVQDHHTILSLSLSLLVMMCAQIDSCWALVMAIILLAADGACSLLEKASRDVYPVF